MRKSAYKTVSILAILIAAILVIAIGGQAQAASGNISFHGYLLPETPNTHVDYPDTIVSFSDQVLLPLPANMAPSVKVRSVSSEGTNGADSTFVSIYTGSGVYRNFQQVQLRDINKQILTVCETGTGRCVNFKVLRSR